MENRFSLVSGVLLLFSVTNEVGVISVWVEL